MGQLLIRNVDDRVIKQLKRKAALKGHSLEQELRETVTAAGSAMREQRGALFRQMRESMPPLENFDVGAAIRHGRDDEFDE